jgi:hypothetical protein
MNPAEIINDDKKIKFENKENQLQEQNEKLIHEINAEKKLLEEQLQLLKALKEEIKNPVSVVNQIANNNVQNVQNVQNQQPPAAPVVQRDVQNASNNNAQKLIDNINLKNSQLQNLIAEKLQNANQALSNDTKQH